MLLGVGGTIVGAGAVAGATSGIADEDSKKKKTGDDGATGSDDSVAEASQFEGVHHNEAVLWDHDMDMAFTNRMRLAADPADPADGGRQGVVHVTSAGESQDYAVSGIDLRSRDLTLGDVNESGSFTYDYFKGEDASYKVPDEAFLILQRADGGISVTYRKKDTDQRGVWDTRDVSSEFSKGDWRAIDVDAGDIDVEDEQVRVTSEVIGQNIMALREQEHYAGVLDRFSADASLLAVAIGNGSVDGVVSDAYFDNIQVNETAYTVPATLTMDAEISTPASQRGRTSVTLSFANEEHGVSVNDIDPESVRLSSYSPFAPPIPGTGDPSDVVLAEGATVSGNALEAEFGPGQVQRLTQGNRMPTVLVFGAFEERPYRFVATAELGRGRGN